jgi:hypothetical protein
LADAPKGIGQAGDDMPAHDSMPAKYNDGRTQHDVTCWWRLPPPKAFVSAFRSIELKAVAFYLVFSTTFLYYTFVKFNQEKNRPGIRDEQPRPGRLRAGGPVLHPFS